MELHSPDSLRPLDSLILQRILDTPFVILHMYVPKSESLFGVTTMTSPNALNRDDSVMI